MAGEEQVKGLSVRELLGIPHFREASLLSGEQGLDKLVSRVNVMEVPDVVDWVRPGEFLMTTGYPFRKKPELLASLISQLVEKGVVALGIKPRRFIQEVPASAIAAAEAHGLPLIELPPDTAFSDVVREVMSRVIVQESRELSILQNRVQRLSHVLLHGDGLSAFLSDLQMLVGNPVLLLDAQNRWTASPGAQALADQVEGASWQKLREDSALEVSSFVQVGHQLSRAYVCTVTNAHRPYLLVLLELERECDVVDTLTLNWASKLVGFEISNAQARRTIEAKYIDQFLQDWIAGRIVSPVDLRLRAEACGCPLQEQAAYTVGVVTFGQRHMQVGELQRLAKWLSWESGGLPGIATADVRWTVLEEQLVVLLSEQVGATKSDVPTAQTARTTRTVATVATAETAQTVEAAETAKTARTTRTVATVETAETAQTVEAARTVRTARTVQTVQTVQTVETAETVPTARTATETGALWRIQRQHQAVTAIARALRQADAPPFTLCLGGRVQLQEHVPGSFREAKRAAVVSKACGLTQQVVMYDQLGIYLLLYRLLGTEEAEEFQRTYLQPLLDYDARHQAAFVKTLQAYLACNGNVKETAERLFVHYNTVTYRLERMRSELGLRLDEAETRLQLQLALKLGEIRER